MILTLVSLFLALGITISLIGSIVIFVVQGMVNRRCNLDITIHMWLVASLWTFFYWSLM